MADFDFKKIGDLEMIDEVQEDDTVLVVRDGSLYRAAGGGLGGGNYAINVGDNEITGVDDTLFVSAPIPGLLDAVEKGANVIVKTDLGLLLAGEPMNEPMFLIAEGGFVSLDALVDLMGDDEDSDEDNPYKGKGMVMTGASINGNYAPVLLTNGVDISELTGASASGVSTLSLDGEAEADTPYARLMTILKKFKEKWEARRNVSVGNTD